MTLMEQLDQAEWKAIDSLSRYKFMQFGYWAAIWVHLNRAGGFKRPNPFRAIVQIARDIKSEGACCYIQSKLRITKEEPYA
jgi:hypothetical protein